jgi:type I restriction enzyme S subunit
MTNKNVPKLRFPEFLESWTTQKIENIAKINDGTHTTPNYVDSGIKFISVENIEDFSKSNKFIEKEAYQKYKVKSKKNDIFLTRIGTIGESNILTEDETYAYYVSLALIRCNNEINPFYLNQYIKSEFFQRELWNKTLHNAVPKKINLNDLEQCLISFPRLLDEQNKIACFLFDIDKKIGLLKDKKEGFIEFKHYLLQNLFPQNGSCVPKLRFEEFNSDWKTVKIKDIFSERSEKDFGELELLSVTLNDGVIPRSELDEKDNSSNNKNNYKHVKPGDIVYNSMRMWQGASGVSSLEGIVSPAYTVLTPNEDINSIFYGYYFKTAYILNEFKKYSQGLTSDTWNLKYPLISQINITTTSFNEQEKIDSLLTYIDNKIELLDKEIESVEEYKKGLLQKMFI